MKELYYHGRAVDGRRFTVTGVYNTTIGELIIGVSLCSSKDNFCRKTGRMISSGRVRKYLKTQDPGIKGITTLLVPISASETYKLHTFLTEAKQFNLMNSNELKRFII